MSLSWVLEFGVSLMVVLLTVSAVEVVWAGIGFSLFGIGPVRYWPLCICHYVLLCSRAMMR